MFRHFNVFSFCHKLTWLWKAFMREDNTTLQHYHVLANVHFITRQSIMTFIKCSSHASHLRRNLYHVHFLWLEISLYCNLLSVFKVFQYLKDEIVFFFIDILWTTNSLALCRLVPFECLTFGPLLLLLPHLLHCVPYLPNDRVLRGKS